jgi:hypothetical protein
MAGSSVAGVIIGSEARAEAQARASPAFLSLIQ